MRVDENGALGRVGSVLGDLLGQDPFSGGGAGTYLFADLAELDSVATQWRAERDKIFERNEKIRQAIDQVAAPAEDLMSVGQADAFRGSLEKLQEHNQALFDYADSYVNKLVATRNYYAAVEDANTRHMKSKDLGA
jgi:uncharacterized protein with von Willebrand factor type A (vWA) domain